MWIRKSGDLPIEKRSGICPQITSNWSQPIIMEILHFWQCLYLPEVLFDYVSITSFYHYDGKGRFFGLWFLLPKLLTVYLLSETDQK